MTAGPRSDRSATTGRPGRAPRAPPAAWGAGSSRAGGPRPGPQAEPEQIRARGRRPQEPFEPRHGRENHDDINVVSARDTLVDALEPAPLLGWMAIDQPPYRRHADRNAEEREQRRAGQTQLRSGAVHVRDDGGPGREVNDVVRDDVEPSAERGSEELEAGHLTVAAVENTACPEQERTKDRHPQSRGREQGRAPEPDEQTQGRDDVRGERRPDQAAGEPDRKQTIETRQIAVARLVQRAEKPPLGSPRAGHPARLGPGVPPHPQRR